MACCSTSCWQARPFTYLVTSPAGGRAQHLHRAAHPLIEPLDVGGAREVQVLHADLGTGEVGVPDGGGVVRLRCPDDGQCDGEWQQDSHVVLLGGECVDEEPPAIAAAVTMSGRWISAVLIL